MSSLLIGLDGNDNLNGGANNSTFVFATSFGQDTISTRPAPVSPT